MAMEALLLELGRLGAGAVVAPVAFELGDERPAPLGIAGAVGVDRGSGARDRGRARGRGRLGGGGSGLRIPVAAGGGAEGERHEGKAPVFEKEPGWHDLRPEAAGHHSGREWFGVWGTPTAPPTGGEGASPLR